jgi:hypothetical protein
MTETHNLLHEKRCNYVYKPDISYGKPLTNINIHKMQKN